MLQNQWPGPGPDLARARLGPLWCISSGPDLVRDTIIVISVEMLWNTMGMKADVERKTYIIMAS